MANKAIKEHAAENIFALLSDEDFLILHEKLSCFNPFSILKLKEHEIRHSNMLAWLLNPNESHGLGFCFLEQFILAAAEDEDTAGGSLLAARIFNTSARPMVSVKREAESKEKKRIDIQVNITWSSETDKDTENYIVLIENKIYSKQEKTQLADYFSDAEKRNAKSVIVPVYLTLDEDDEPNDGHYLHITYRDVLVILKKALQKEKENGRESPALLFIAQYTTVLEELMGMDTEKQRLAKEIYRKYRETIEFINQNAETSIANAGNAFINSYKNDGIQLSACKRNNSVFFPFMDEVLQKTNDGKLDDWREGGICGYFFELKKNSPDDAFGGKLALKIEVGPFEDCNKRQQFLDALMDSGFTFLKKSSGKSKYTRLNYEKQPSSQKIKDVSDEEELAKAMEDLFKKTKNMRRALHKCIEGVLKKNN